MGETVVPVPGFAGKGRRVRGACNTKPACSSKHGGGYIRTAAGHIFLGGVARDIRRLSYPEVSAACLVDVTDLEMPV